ncbi:unnamed protein product [Arabis nemorensis]|uniref:Uncharacterized protein n=1 Tax=Arabis nemorensis TaxID=586526 RepID=A0A565B8H2_9BRAS|nr:unnamed protein product [Arabis nemorensis]
MLHGLDKEFVPLCPRYLCQNVNQKAYLREIRKSKNSRPHRCYGGDKEEGLIYVKRHGIPKENPRNKDFNCYVPRRVGKKAKKYKIKDVFHYQTLQDALIRVKTHPIKIITTLSPLAVIGRQGNASRKGEKVKIKDGEAKAFSPEEINAMLMTKMKEEVEASWEENQGCYSVANLHIHIVGEIFGVNTGEDVAVHGGILSGEGSDETKDNVS